MRLSDELDVTSDRNLFFDYSNIEKNYSDYQLICYKCHKALKSLSFDNNTLTMYYSSDEEEVLREIADLKGKIEKSLLIYKEIISKDDTFSCTADSVIFQSI